MKYFAVSISLFIFLLTPPISFACESMVDYDADGYSMYLSMSSAAGVEPLTVSLCLEPDGAIMVDGYKVGTWQKTAAGIIGDIPESNGFFGCWAHPGFWFSMWDICGHIVSQIAVIEGKEIAFQSSLEAKATRKEISLSEFSVEYWAADLKLTSSHTSNAEYKGYSESSFSMIWNNTPCSEKLSSAKDGSTPSTSPTPMPTAHCG